MGSGSPVSAYLIGVESTWGTPVTADKDIGIVEEVASSPEREGIEIMSIGQIEAVSNESGVISGSHTVNMKYQHARIFDYILGAPTHALTGSDTKHTFTSLVDNEPLSFTAETGQNLTAGDVGMQFAGCMIESAELSIELNDVLKLSFTAKSEFPTMLSTVPSHSIDTLQVFPHSLCSVKFNGVAASEVQSFTLSFNKTLDPVNGLGSNEHQSMVASSLTLAFSGQLAFDDSTYHDHFDNNDVTAIIFAADNGTSLGSGERSIDIALQDIEMQTFEVTATAGAVVFVSFSGIARLNTMETVDDIAEAAWD